MISQVKMSTLKLERNVSILHFSQRPVNFTGVLSEWSLFQGWETFLTWDLAAAYNSHHPQPKIIKLYSFLSRRAARQNGPDVQMHLGFCFLLESDERWYKAGIKKYSTDETLGFGWKSFVSWIFLPFFAFHLPKLPLFSWIIWQKVFLFCSSCWTSVTPSVTVFYGHYRHPVSL